MLTRHKIAVLKVFLILKLVQFLIVWVVPNQFDKSSYTDETFWNKIVVWDNVYFESLFHDGPHFEHEWVFGPFWFRLVSFLHDYFNIQMEVFLFGVALSNICQLMNSFLIYEITNLFFPKESLRVSILYLLGSYGIIGSVPYSENFATMMIFLGLYLREISFINQMKNIYALSSIFFSIAFMTRSNTLIIGLVYVYDLIKFRKFTALISGIILGMSVLFYHWVPYSEYCPGRPWCDKTIPSIYSFAQSYYWDNGFLKYWSMNNLFNFAISVPVIVLHFQSALQYWSTRWWILSVITLVHLIICVFFINVQIVIRISSYLPLQYWYLSGLISEKRGKLWISYLLVWHAVQTVAFTAFLPPA